MLGQVLADRFEIMEVAGSGGMATVYRARDRERDSVVAIKVLEVASASDQARFEREADLLARLEHPHIVRCLGRGVLAAGHPYLVLEWLEGETLSARLERGTPSLDESLDLVARLSRALGFAHRLGVVHRDVKPGNVILLGAGFDQPKLLDFGVARVLLDAQAMTRTGTALGTPAYMAPEQARGARELDARADTYALGCLLFECLSGQPAFDGQDVMAILAKVLFDEAPSLARFRPDAPDELVSLCARLLSKDPAERHANGDALSFAIEQLREEVSDGRVGAQRAPTRPPLPLTEREQRLVAVVAIAPLSDQGRAGPTARTLAADDALPVTDLAREARRFDASFAALANGSALAVLEGGPSAIDLTMRGASCALAFAARCPTLPVALSVGRASGRRVPVGDVIDRVVAELALARKAPVPGAVRIDTLAESLLRARFAVAEDELGFVLAAPSASGEPRGRRPTSPFVGRSRERRMLDALLEECVGESAACAAVVTGEPGFGKTRLVEEWLSGVTAAETRLVRWHVRGDPSRESSPLSAVVELVRDAIGSRRGAASPGELLARHLAALTGRSPTEDRRLARVQLFLAELLGGPLPEGGGLTLELEAARAEATLMGDQLRLAFEDFVASSAAAAPLVIVVDDAHWIDVASLRFLDAALRHSRQAPLLMLIVGQTQALERVSLLPNLKGALSIRLAELPRKACEQFVDLSLERALASEERARIVDQAAGNPFFLEELVRFADEGRGGELPSSLVAMVQARLEALPPECRRVLRAASVFGSEFWLEGVEVLLGTRSESRPGGSLTGGSIEVAAAQLLDAEIVETRVDSRFPGRRQLQFRQDLYRIAAYSMLTDRDRAAGHRLAAAWLEPLPDVDPAVLAEHLERGGAGPRAAGFWGRAAERALDGHDFTGALTLVARARRAAGEQAPTFASLFLVEAEALRFRGDLAEAERAALAALEGLPSGSQAWFSAAALLAGVAGVAGDFSAAVLLESRIRACGCEPGAESDRVLALAAVGRRLFQMGDYDSAISTLDQLDRERTANALALSERAIAELERLRGASARHRGDVAADYAGYGRALAAFERAGDLRGACNTRVSFAFALIELGAHARARAELELAQREARRLGLPTVETRAQQNLSLVLAAEGRLEQAMALADAVVADAHARGDERFEGWTRIYLSRFALELGDPRRALAEAELACAVLTASPPAYAGALAARSLALLGSEAVEEADLAAREAAAILAEYDGIEEFEALVMLAELSAACATADGARARALAAAAKARLVLRAQAISDPELRRSFLQAVRDNVELAAMCEAGDALPVPPPSEPTGSTRRELWSERAFAADAAGVVARLEQHLALATAGGGRVLRGFPSPEELLATVPEPLGEAPILALHELVDQTLERSPWQHHPRYVGHQVSAALPRAAVLSMVAALLNNGMAAYESGPFLTVLERRVIELFCSLVPWGPGAGGVLTSGGSLGNLTALLAARQARAGFDARERGLSSQPPLALLSSEQTHYSIERAAQIMGLGRDAVFAVPTDARFRVVPSQIEPMLRRAEAQGRRAIAMCASAGATGTGSVDPLSAVADECERLGLWLHVDGAHGASALLSPRERAALDGIERADSLVWDAHKLMSMPALSTAVLFRDGRVAYASFAQQASYLFRGDDERWFDVGLRTVECTKPLIALPLYGCLATLGIAPFREAIEHAYALARAFARLLVAAPDFELACEPDSNIVCFRHQGDDDRQRRVVAALRESGAFYLVMTSLRGRVFLRVSLMNPLTSLEDLAQLLESIRAVV